MCSLLLLSVFGHFAGEQLGGGLPELEDEDGDFVVVEDGQPAHDRAQRAQAEVLAVQFVELRVGRRDAVLVLQRPVRQPRLPAVLLGDVLLGLDVLLLLELQELPQQL
jgi:hypothetical protein